MNQHSFEVLQYHEIKSQIANFALTTEGKQKIMDLFPSTHLKQIEAWLDEVSEAVNILNKSASVPVHGLEGMERLLGSLNKGTSLRTEQITGLSDFLDCCAKMRRYMKDKEFIAPRVSSYVHSIENLPELASEISRCIRNGAVDDYASKELLKVRKQISIETERLKERVQQFVRSNKYKSYLQENVVSQRNGRYVIPIKKEYRNKINGTVLDASASGATLFLEPTEIAAYQDELEWLLADEETEVHKVLMYLTGLVEANENQIRLAFETMVHYDILFAKAKYSRSIDGVKVKANEENYLNLIDARHPLLGQNAIPLTIELGNPESALVITGPNTGGKTVTIKTVGLLTLMVQSGLLIPVAEGSMVSIFQKIMVDIGDGQSIVDNLSTFSSRIKNIIGILEEATPRTLALLDELGSGTDPREGMGLATAILEQLYAKGTTLLATTHYSEIKEYAESHQGFLNGSMEFDLETLKPTYKLLIGEGGESQAFSIAMKLGMHPKVIERAHQITYKEEKRYDSFDIDPERMKQREKQVIINKYKNHIRKNANKETPVPIFVQGDNVQVYPSEEFGIVYSGPDALGNYIVQVKGEKQTHNHKRLKLYISAKELYPEDYDFDIIFKTVEHRKLNKSFSKGHVEGAFITLDE